MERFSRFLSQISISNFGLYQGMQWVLLIIMLFMTRCASFSSLRKVIGLPIFVKSPPTFKHWRSIQSGYFASLKDLKPKKQYAVSRNIVDVDHTPQLPTPMGELSEDFKVADRDAYLFGEDVERQSFRQVGVMESLCKALEKCGKTIATSIQSKSFPVVLSGVDVVIGAETGSGKTLSYLLPLVQKCLENPPTAGSSQKYPSVVVMVPNRELGMQVERMAQELVDALKEQGLPLSIKAVATSSERWPFSHEDGPLAGPDILVCTPAFLSRFVKGGHATEVDLFRSVRHLVLDEADMLLEGGYLPEVEKILDAFKFIRRDMIGQGEIKVHETVLQHILSAATLPSYGLRSMEKYIEHRYPRAVKVSNAHLHKHHPCIKQSYFRMEDDSVVSAERISAIVSACAGDDPVMIFVNTAEVGLHLADALRDNGIECAEFHNKIVNRLDGLHAFRAGDVKVLICTDVAARGLDLPHVRHVIQAEFATNIVQHLHRIGRASRAGVSGRATCFYDKRSELLVESIQTGSIEGSFSRRRGLRKKWKKGI